MAETVAIILAAGGSTRMNTQLAKVLHEVCGRPMLAYVLQACRKVGIKKIHVVVGFSADQVKDRFADADDIVWVHQAEQLGTAHAVMCCREHLQDFDGQTLILCGDGPLLRSQTLRTLMEKHEALIVGRSCLLTPRNAPISWQKNAEKPKVSRVSSHA